MGTTPRLLNDARTFPPLTHCVFDLAGTLFWSSAFDQLTAHQAILCISDHLGLDLPEAKERLDTQRTWLSDQCGYTIALSTTLCSLGIDLEKWSTYQRQIRICEVVRKDQTVTNWIRHLSEAYTLGLYTNMCRPLALEVLTHFSLEGVWRFTITPQESKSTKPDHKTANTISKSNLTDIQATIAVGDRYHIDIEPFLDIGSYGYLVQSKHDLQGLVNRLCGL